MAQVIQLPKGHLGVPSQASSPDEKNFSSTLVNRLINQLKETKTSFYKKSHQNLKKIKKRVTKNPQLKYIKQLAGQATDSIQKVPKNLKKRIDSVLNHIGNIMASSPSISLPTFYQSLVITFIKKYPHQLCDKLNDDGEMPSFEQFYQQFLSTFKSETEAGEEEYALALVFYEEISKEIEDQDYQLMNDVILSAISMTIDSAILGSHTRNQLYLTYKGFIRIASAQNSPKKDKTEQKLDDAEFQKKLTYMQESNKDAWDEDDQAQAMLSQAENEEESEKQLNNQNSEDLPKIPDIDNIEFESQENPNPLTDLKIAPFAATLEEFTQKFEGEVIWDQLEEKIEPQTIAKASFEYYQILKLDFSELRNQRPRPASMLSLRGQQRFIKSVYQQIMDHLQSILTSSSIKSLDYYEKSVKWLERQIIGSEQEQQQSEVIQALTEDGQIQTISTLHKRKRFQNLNTRVTNLCLFTLGTIYQNIDQKVDFQKWQNYLTPYFEGAKPFYLRAKVYTLTTYQRVNQEIIIPMNEKLVVVVNKGSAFFSIYVKQKVAQAKITQIALEKLNSSRVLINKQWMRLDFDNDGVVSIEDCKNTAKQVYTYLKQKKLIELKERATSVYQRSLLRLKNMKARVLAIKQKSD